MFRYGKIDSVDPDTMTARVTFEDKDGVVTYPLWILVANTRQNKDYFLPDEGESVVCLFLSNNSTHGFVLGAFYPSSELIPFLDRNVRGTKFENGTELSHNRSDGTITISTPGVINIDAEKVNIIAEVNITGPLNVNGQSTVTGGDMVADGISLKRHVHPENDSGGPTGPPKGGG